MRLLSRSQQQGGSPALARESASHSMQPDSYNQDPTVVRGFGDEWTRLDQSALQESEKLRIFEDYFAIFPWASLPREARGCDVGCGSGRWAAVVAPRVGHLHLLDASPEALEVARKNTAGSPNVSYHCFSVDQLPFADAELDFAYSLGVLHHIPDTLAGIKSVTRVLKSGAPFLIYLYYSFDNRPAWYRWTWRLSELVRHLVSSLPLWLRYPISQLLALFVYLPLATAGRLLRSLGFKAAHFPLAYYQDKSFYTMRTDALDRFGTKLERRFSRKEVQEMLERAGLRDIHFSNKAPFWCAIAVKT